MITAEPVITPCMCLRIHCIRKYVRKFWHINCCLTAHNTNTHTCFVHHNTTQPPFTSTKTTKWKYMNTSEVNHLLAVRTVPISVIYLLSPWTHTTQFHNQTYIFLFVFSFFIYKILFATRNRSQFSSCFLLLLACCAVYIKAGIKIHFSTLSVVLVFQIL